MTLLYHDVAPRGEFDSVGFPGPLAARYKLEPAAFDAHLTAIVAIGLEVGLIEESSRPPVAFSFDDGGSRSLSTADALESRGWRGHFFVTTGLLERPGFIGAEEVTELRRRGHIVGSHSHSHPTLMGKLAPAQIEEEWRRSRDVLGGVLGEEPKHASVPGGYLSQAVIHGAAYAGYRVLMTSEPVSTVYTLDQLQVFGRYSISSTTSPSTAAAYAAGGRSARARLSWRTKQIVKTISPAGYELLRRLGARASQL
ncbi:MAG: polysaccharide deacetylase family protein [Actinomycetota bacterium]|nr:polysaccharide deacetylase family protein [Actinomycetota bacterium]